MTTAHMDTTVNEIRPTHWRALWISDIHLGTAGCKAESVSYTHLTLPTKA